MKRIVLILTVALCGVITANKISAAEETTEQKPKGPLEEVKLIMSEDDKAALKEIYGTYYRSQKDADEAGKKAAALVCFESETKFFQEVIDRVKKEGKDVAKAQAELDAFTAKKDEMLVKILDSAKPKPNPIAPITDIMNEEEKAALKEIYGANYRNQTAAPDEEKRRDAAVLCFDSEVELFKKVIARVKADSGDTAKAQEALDKFVAKKDEMVIKILESVKPVQK